MSKEYPFSAGFSRGQRRQRSPTPTPIETHPLVLKENSIEFWQHEFAQNKQRLPILEMKDEFVADVVVPIRYKTYIFVSDLTMGRLGVYKLLVLYAMPQFPSLCTVDANVKQNLIQFMCETYVDYDERKKIDEDPAIAREMIYSIMSNVIWSNKDVLSSIFTPSLCAPTREADVHDGVQYKGDLWSALEFFDPENDYQETEDFIDEFRTSLSVISRYEEENTLRRPYVNHIRLFSQLAVIICCAGSVSPAKILKIQTSFKSATRVDLDFSREDIRRNSEEVFRVMTEYKMNVSFLLASWGTVFKANQFQPLVTLIDQAARRRASVFNIIWSVITDEPELPIFHYIYENHVSEWKAYIDGMEALARDPYVWTKSQDNKERRKIFARNVKHLYLGCRYFMEVVRQDRNIKQLETSVGLQESIVLKKIVDQYKQEMERKAIDDNHNFARGENVWLMGGDKGVGWKLRSLRAQVDKRLEYPSNDS